MATEHTIKITQAHRTDGTVNGSCCMQLTVCMCNRDLIKL